MANVGDRIPVGRSVERGQLILVTGLTIAVILVALVLLLNTVIYTENVATRGVDPGGGDAIEFRATVVGSVGELIAEENAVEYQDYPALEANLSNGTDLLHDRIERRHLERGIIANFSVEPTQGAHIWQDTDAEFLDTGGDHNWTIVSGVDDFRKFNVTVDYNDLSDNESNALAIDFDNGSKTVSIYKNTSNSTIEISDGTTVCNGNGTEATLDFVNLSVSGGTDSCSAMNYTSAVSGSFDVDIIRGNETNGTYELTVGENVSVTNGGTPPQYAMMVYSAELSIHYESRDLVFTTAVRIEGADPR